MAEKMKRVMIAGENIRVELEGSQLEEALREKGFEFSVSTLAGAAADVEAYDPGILLVELSRDSSPRETLLSIKSNRPELFVFLAVRPEDFDLAAGYWDLDLVDILLRPVAVEEAFKEKKLESCGGTRFVHVVDDEKDVVKHYSRFLAKRGYEITSSHTALAALQDLALAKNKPYVLMLDIQMPGQMDGLALLDKIRTGDNFREPDRDTLVIMATGLRTEEAIKQAARLGISSFCAKPIDLKERLLPELRLACFKRKLIDLDRNYCTGGIVPVNAREKDIPAVVEKLKQQLVSRFR